MPGLKKRKPLLWLLIDFIATFFLLAGIFKIVDFEVPYISDIFRPYSAILLISVGIVVTIASMLLFIVPIIKANKTKATNIADERASNQTIERTKR